MESFSGRSTRQPVPAPREAAPQPLRAPEPVAHRDSAHASRGGASKTPKVKKGLLWTIAAVVLGAAILFAGSSGYNALVQGQLIDGGIAPLQGAAEFGCGEFFGRLAQALLQIVIELDAA